MRYFLIPYILHGLFFFTAYLRGYSEPFINLGFTSFLDGGPLRPSPGWYWGQFTQYYDAHKFRDKCGNTLRGVRSPHFNYWAGVTELSYQSDQKILWQGKWGVSGWLSYTFSSHIERNLLGIKTSGGGVGDLGLGIYLQWDPVNYHDRPFFVHRLEFDASFPTGKSKQPQFIFNPGNNFFFINPHWAATLFITSDWSLSWRLHYLWSAKDRTTKKQPGDAIHLNYALAYQIKKERFYIGINGYFLQQIKDDTQHGQKIPNSRERIFAIGPGLLYSNVKDFDFFVNLYFESLVRNREEGISLILHWIKLF